MEPEEKIIRCSTCGDIMIAGMVNGKKLKNCRKCRDKRANRNPQSDTQEISHPPYSSEEEQDEGERPRVIPTYTSSENHYSNMPLCKPDFLMTPPQKPQSVKQLLSSILDSLTNKSSNTIANDMLNDIANRLTAIEHDNYVREFIEQQKKHNEETTRLLNMLYDAIG
jgi:DNA-directed RNA polymerase subunit M/transcription elongation factor TFIIS